MEQRVHNIADAASVGSYSTAGGTMVIGGLTTNELLALAGFVLALLTFITNQVYRYKTYKLEKERHRKLMEAGDAKLQ